MIGRETRVLLRHYLEQGLSKAAVARRIGVGERTVHRWIAAGQLDREAEIVDPFAAVRGRVFLLPMVDLLHDDIEAAMAFDPVPIGSSDGLAEHEDLFFVLAHVSGRPGHWPDRCGPGIRLQAGPLLLRQGRESFHGPSMRSTSIRCRT